MGDSSKKKQFFGRPNLRPGFYDSADFAVFERANPSGAIELYAEQVLRRPQPTNVRERIERLARALVETASAKEIERNCGLFSLALVRGLERLGVWAFALRGSVRYVFAPGTGFDSRVSCVTDKQGPGHVWVVAPPFSVVDITARHQGWQNGEAALIPCPVLGEVAEQIAPDPHPDLAGNPGPELADFWTRFRPCRVVREKVAITYQPWGINLPPADETVESFPIKVGGRTLVHIVEELALGLRG